MNSALLTIIILALFLAVPAFAGAIVINKEYERALRYRLGAFKDVFKQGFHLKIPIFDSIDKVDYRVKSQDVEPQNVMTRDNVTVSVDAIVFFKVKRNVEELKKAILEVEDYSKVTIDYAQTMLRDIIGKKELDEVLQKREEIAETLRDELDQETDKFGVKVENVEIKDVSVPDDLERAMASEAEAERERRARIKNATGELQASKMIRVASELLGKRGYQLRTLQTVEDVAIDNSTIVTIPSSLVPSKGEEDEKLFEDTINKIVKGKDLSEVIDELGSEEISEMSDKVLSSE